MIYRQTVMTTHSIVSSVEEKSHGLRCRGFLAGPMVGGELP